MASAAMARRMTALVRQWDMSGECKAEFLRRCRVPRSTFEYWKRRVRSAAPAPAPVAFAPVRLVATPVDANGTITVVLATGDRLIIPPGVSADHVRTIVSAVRAAC